MPYHRVEVARVRGCSRPTTKPGKTKEGLPLLSTNLFAPQVPARVSERLRNATEAFPWERAALPDSFFDSDVYLTGNMHSVFDAKSRLDPGRTPQTLYPPTQERTAAMESVPYGADRFEFSGNPVADCELESAADHIPRSHPEDPGGPSDE